MALLVHTWDLPRGRDKLEQYRLAGEEWIPAVLRAPGCREFRGYRNPLRASPQVMVEAEFDTLENLQRWLDSAEYQGILQGLASLGCTNIQVQVWEASPVVRQPRRPGDR